MSEEENKEGEEKSWMDYALEAIDELDKTSPFGPSFEGELEQVGKEHAWVETVFYQIINKSYDAVALGKDSEFTPASLGGLLGTKVGSVWKILNLDDVERISKFIEGKIKEYPEDQARELRDYFEREGERFEKWYSTLLECISAVFTLSFCSESGHREFVNAYAKSLESGGKQVDDSFGLSRYHINCLLFRHWRYIGGLSNQREIYSFLTEKHKGFRMFTFDAFRKHVVSIGLSPAPRGRPSKEKGKKQKR